MHGGLATLPGTAWFDTLLNGMDIMSVTYYPLQSDFRVEHPSHISGDIQLIADILPSDMSIILQEFGYPSGYLSDPQNNSTQDKQAQFYKECNQSFTPLIVNNRLRVASGFKLIDWSSDTCDYFGIYYGVDNPQFIEYLCTLGMLTYDGTEKLAFQVFLSMIGQEYEYIDITSNPTVSPSSPPPSTTDGEDSAGFMSSFTYVIYIYIAANFAM